LYRTGQGIMNIQPQSFRPSLVLFLSLILSAVVAGQETAQQLKPPELHWLAGFLSLKDGVKLAYILYKPAKEGRFPVLVTYDAYWGGGSTMHREEVELLRHGYAVVGVSVRGTGASQGLFNGPFAKQEGEDGKEVIEWVGTQPWCDGNVGMYGTSYAGVSQFEVASQRPKCLKALAAGSVWSDDYEDVSYPGGIFNIALVAQWSFFTQPQTSSRGARIREFAPALGDKVSVIRAPAPGKGFDAMRAHPFKDAWWAERTFDDAASQIETPTMIFQGWQDQQAGARGAVRLFERLKGPKRIMLSNGGEGTFFLAPMRAERIRWFDRWLKGEHNRVDKEPAVTIWFETRPEKAPNVPSEKELGALEDSKKTNSRAKLPLPSSTEPKPAWVSTFSAWPIPDVQWSTFYLTSDGKLTQGKPPSVEASGRRSYLYPTGTEIASTNEMFSTSPAPIGCLVYRTGPLPEDMAIIGSPVVTLHASSEQQDTDFMAGLHDINPEGQVTYVQRGLLRASHRALDAKKSTAHEPIHMHDKGEELTPGKIYEVKFSLLPVGHVLRRGHSLELAIMTPPNIPSPSWGFAQVTAPGLNTIYHSAKNPSTLELPVVSMVTAQGPAPPFGSLPLQPARGRLPTWDAQRKALDEILLYRNTAGGARP
jgi:predicted acyl esterase